MLGIKNCCNKTGVRVGANKLRLFCKKQIAAGDGIPRVAVKYVDAENTDNEGNRACAAGVGGKLGCKSRLSVSS